MNYLQKNFELITEKIRNAEIQYHRAAHSVGLLVVTKGRHVNELVTLINAGQHCFGESYSQEALTKIALLKNYHIEWRFIGPIQSNKTKLIAENFSWVESVARLKIAQRLSAQRPPALPPLNICIEINVGNESTKSGMATYDEVMELANAIKQLPNLKLRGLMAIPPPSSLFLEQRANFHKVKVLFDQLNEQGFALDTLSIGMSDDFEAAIAEGATQVRIGSAIFI